MRLFLLAVLLLFGALPARAEPRGFRLQPGSGAIGFRAYGLGLLPIDGGFTRFSGTLTLDPAAPGACRLELHAEAASLAMSDPAITEDALGPDLLDVVHFPEFGFHGECKDGAITGPLLLHGVSRPVTLSVEVRDGRWTATGTMRRAEWGMGARPLLAGPEVRLQVTVALPPGFPPRS